MTRHRSAGLSRGREFRPSTSRSVCSGLAGSFPPVYCSRVKPLPALLPFPARSSLHEPESSYFNKTSALVAREELFVDAEVPRLGNRVKDPASLLSLKQLGSHSRPAGRRGHVRVRSES